MQIRPFAESDYPALAHAYAQVSPDAPRSEAELRYLDSRQKPPYRQARWVAEAAGSLLGWCEYTQHPSWYHPDKYDVALGVVPAAQGQGLGRSLYERLFTALEPHHPQALRTNVLETHTRQLAFFSRRGFSETQRSWLSTLDLGTFDPQPFAEVLRKAERSGFEVTSVAAVEADEARLPELYTFYQELVADLPRTQSYTPWSFEQFVMHRRTSPLLLPEGSFIVLQGGTLAAVSELKRSAQPGQLQTGLTAVRRAYRGRGLALLSKLHTATYAQVQGVAQITTRNASSNRAMLRINERLGFVRGVADIELVKNL
jgi:mycothiol synthase